MATIRAFRGTRRRSIYRRHLLPDDALRRIAAAAGAEGRTVLASLRTGEARELDKDESRRLAADATHLRAHALLPDLDADLTELAELAHWCARSREDAWLTVD